MTLQFTSERTDSFPAGWSRRVEVDGQGYVVSVRHGKMVRIPYKPRGRNRGWRWVGTVFRTGANPGYVWEGRVPGSIGCKGLLIKAGIITA